MDDNKRRRRINRLPLPTGTIKDLCLIRAKNSNDIGLTNMIANTLNSLADYEYDEAIKILSYIQEDYPDLMNYNKYVRAIRSAKQRYDNI